MKSYTLTDLKSNIDSICDEIVKECEAVEFVRRRRQRFVIMSKNEYDNLIENDYTMRNIDYYDKLIAILAGKPNQTEDETEDETEDDEPFQIDLAAFEDDGYSNDQIPF